jgi:anti-sigma factor RsiW
MRALAFISSSPNLQTCHDCTAEYLRQEVLRAAIRRPEPRYRAPHDLRARVIASIQSQTDVLCRAPWWRGGITGWLGAGVSLALATSLLSVVTMPGEQAIQRELISGHVRSLLASHLTDVTTSNEHTIKPWFNGKLDASPPVVDLAPLTARAEISQVSLRSRRGITSTAPFAW